MKRFLVAAAAALAFTMFAGSNEANAGDVRFQFGFSVAPNGGYFYSQQGIGRNHFGFGTGYNFQIYRGPYAPYGVYQYQVYPVNPYYYGRPYVHPYAYPYRPYGYYPYNPYLRRW